MNTAGHHSGEKRIRAKFEPDEDELLKQLVQKYGLDWVKIASQMSGRNVRQCRERWSHYLCSDTAKRPWTPEEDQILLQTVKEIGTKWCKVINHLTDRTDIQAKTRWLRLTNRKTIHDKPSIVPKSTSDQITITEPISDNFLKENPTKNISFPSDLSNPNPSFQIEKPVTIEHHEEVGQNIATFNLFLDDPNLNSPPRFMLHEHSDLSVNLFPDLRDPEDEISLLFFQETNVNNSFLDIPW